MDVLNSGGTAYQEVKLGQQLAAASLPVTLPALQVTAMTPPAAITGFATSAKQDNILTMLGYGLTLYRVPIAAAKNATRTLVAAVTNPANKSICIHEIWLAGGAAGTMTIQDGADTPIVWVAPVVTVAGDGIYRQFNVVPAFIGTTGKALNVVLTTNTDATGYLIYSLA